MQPQKIQKGLSSFSRQTTQHHSDPTHAATNDATETEIGGFYEDIQHLLEQQQKGMTFSS